MAPGILYIIICQKLNMAITCPNTVALLAVSALYMSIPYYWFYYQFSMNSEFYSSSILFWNYVSVDSHTPLPYFVVACSSFLLLIIFAILF